MRTFSLNCLDGFGSHQLFRGGHMQFKFRFLRLAFSAALVVSLSAIVFADTIRLKDGSIIKGKITAFGDGKFTIEMGKRQMSFPAAEIDSIQFDSPRSSPQIVNAAARSTPVTDIEDESEVIEESAPPKVVTRVVKTDTTAKANIPSLSIKAKTQSTTVKPVEIGVKVLADNSSNGWTNSGFVVKKGQKIRITGSGQISIGGGKTVTPSGLYDVEDTGKLLQSVPTGALIAVIGDDNNEFIYVGTSREFTAARDGALFLGVNEGNLNDNSGTFDVKIEIGPA